MDARPKSIRDILHTGDQYVIPLFQRYYSWKKEHWDRIRKDLWALMDDHEKDVHFLGPLVCTPTSHFPGSVPAYQLIDGQQRLTTLTILLAAIRDVAVMRNLSSLAEEVTEDYLLHKRKQGSERFKVLPRFGDREALNAIVEGQDLTPYSDRQVFHAWKYFRRHVEHWARKDSEQQLHRLLDTVSRRLSLVVVTIEGENPYEIFESLNSTGLPLEESDLIRNFVFMQIPHARQHEFDEQFWKKLEGLFAAAEGQPAVPMTPFYRDFIMRNGFYSKEDSTFVDFKNYQKDANLSPEDQVKELIHYAALELMIRRPRAVKHERLRAALTQIDSMEITTAYPLILNLLDRHARGLMNDDDIVGALSDLASFALRRSICGESTRTYGRWFTEAIPALKDNPRHDLRNYLLARRWPDDATVRQRIADFALYSREKRKARIILETIEESFGHKEKVDMANLSIEHVMPQTISNNAPGKNWKAMLGPQWEDVHARLLHTLGNLSLTGYNPDLSNSSFSDKKELLAQSHLELNRHFANLSEWNEPAIKARASALTEEILRLWPRPAVGQEYTASAEALPSPERLSSGEKVRLEYWRHLDSQLEERGVPANLIVPTTKSTIDIAVGDTGLLRIQLGLNHQHGRIHVSLFLPGELGERIANRLQDQKSALEQEIGYPLHWEIAKRSSEIKAADEGLQLKDKEDWPVQHDWFGDRLEDYLRVFAPRVKEYEAEALKDSGLRQRVEQQLRMKSFWQACALVLEGSGLAFRENDPGAGHRYCRFENIDNGLLFGAEITAGEPYVGIYFGIANRASRKYKSKFKELSQSPLSELEAEIDAKIETSEQYFSTYIDFHLENSDEWLRFHQWIRDTALKFRSGFSKRLGVE